MTFPITNIVINKLPGATFSDLSWGLASAKDEIDVLYEQRADEVEGIRIEREMRETDLEFNYAAEL